MRRNVIIVCLLIVLVLAFLVFLLGDIEGVDEYSDDSGFGSNDFVNDSPVDGINNSVNNSTSSFGGGAGGSGGGSLIVGENVPDIKAEACGFYFEQYGVCAGTCPDGECVQDGGSCYCQG